MQFDAIGVQCSEGHGHRNRNGDGGDQSYPQRQQQHGHQNHSDYGDAELAEEIADAVGNDFRLVRHHVQLHIRRQRRLDVLQRRAQRIAEVHDVVALVHLDRQQNGLFVVEARILGGVFVDPLDIGHVADVNRLPRRRNIHHHLPYLVFGLKAAAGFDRHLVLAGRHAARKLHSIAPLQRAHHVHRIYAILRQPFRGGGDIDLFLLIADALDLRNRRERA